jgi:hypothetical protein
MTKEIAIGMLKTGKNGNDILAILETLLNEELPEDNQPTLQEIEF